MKKRKLFTTLKAEKDFKKISLILGPRQVGKTTLLRQLYQDICNEKANAGLYLDLDILSNYEKVASYENLLNTLMLEGYATGQKDTFFLFLDEFQRYTGFSKLLKNISDHHDNIKIYATGSSSLQIKEEIQESLAGRKFIHYLLPLDFEEFLIFKEKEQERKQLKNLWHLKGKDLQIAPFIQLLYEYMVFGGYPEVSQYDDPAAKKQVLETIFDLYVKKDLVAFLSTNRLLNVKKLIEVLAVNHGQKTKFNELAGMCSLKEYEVRNYIEILKETFLIAELRPYFSNKNKEIVKIPKMYFLDPGVRNYFVDNFSAIQKRNDSSFLFEGFILSQLHRAGYSNINYWQDKNKREVDFIINNITDLIPVEVKFKNRIKQNDYSGLVHFAKQYPQTSAYYLITPNAQFSTQLDNIKVDVKLPYTLSF